MKNGKWSRRTILKAGAASLVTAPALLGAKRALAAGREIKLGFVDPRTGPIAAFGEATDYVVNKFLNDMGNQITINGVTHPVRLIYKDTQSNGNRAAEVTNELISSDEVDIVLASSTPDTTNPVADQCEINEVPCVSSDCPWQPYFFGRGGNPAEGFEWTYHFFWGLEDVIANFTNMWNSISTNKVVGGLFPNDADGNAWGDENLGFPKPLAAQGFTLIDPGRYQNLSDDFTSQINAFKAADVEIVTGVMLPPDFGTFWSQAAQLNFRPKIATVGKALLFPAAVEALGPRAEGLSTEVWWTPSHPFSSSATGESCAELASGWTTHSGRPWTQPLGFKHALLEVAYDVLVRATDLDSPEAIRDAIKSTNLNTIVGNVNWSTGPVPNVSKTPLVGGQWKKGTTFPWDLVIVNNQHAPAIPLAGQFEAL